MFLTSIRPDNIDTDMLEFRQIGELLINVVNQDVYMVVTEPQSGKKEVRLIGGSAKYDILNHMERNNVVSKIAPTNFDAGTTWYRTDMLWTEFSGGESDAYIMIRTDNKGGKGQWTNILPVTKVSNVFLGKDTAGNLLTLDTLIKRARLKIAPTVDVQDAELGEIYIKDDNTIWLRKNKDNSTDRLLASANTFMRDRLVKSIAISSKAPVNFDKNTLWLHTTEDSDISLATTQYISSPVDRTTVFGLKFVLDAQNKVQLGATISNEGKTLTIDNNTALDYGYTWINYPISKGNDVYMEFDISDPEDKLSILFLKNGLTQELANSYGVNDRLLLVNSKLSMTENNPVNKVFDFNNRTMFICIKSPSIGVSRIYMGTVNDDGTLNVVYGNSTLSENGLNGEGYARIGFAADNSETPNLHTVINIRTFKVNNIPSGTIGLNNTLPGEKPFEVRAIATNANSLFLSRENKLSNYVFDGRLVIGLRDYKDARSSGRGELMLDYENKVLYAKMMDGSIENLKSRFEDIYYNHIKHGLTLTTKRNTELKVVESDLTITYGSVAEFDTYSATENVVANFVMVDTISGETPLRYKYLVPKTNSELVFHKWKDLVSEADKTTTLKVYLDAIHDAIVTIKRTKNVYSSYIELMKISELNTRFFNINLFLRELIESNRMNPNSLLIQTVGTDIENNLIDKMFNVPSDGILNLYRESSKKAVLYFYSNDGNMYLNTINTDYSINEWSKVIYTKNNITDIEGTVNAGTKINTTDIIAKGDITSGADLTFNNPSVASVKYNNSKSVNGNTTNIIGIKGSNNTNNLTVSIGDEKTDKLEIKSKARPTINGDNVVVTPDLIYNYIWKGKLNVDNNFKDLNQYNNFNAVGYYTADKVIPSGSYNYPVLEFTGITGAVLEVKLLHPESNQYIIQTLTPYVVPDGEGYHTNYTRSFSVTTNKWSKWVKRVTRDEYNSKYDKSGGKISGNVEIANNFTLNGIPTFNDGTIKINESNFNIFSRNTKNNTELITSQIKYDADNKNLMLGSETHNLVSFYNIKRPEWVTTEPLYGETGSTYYKYKLATIIDVTKLSDRLTRDYYTIQDSDTKFKTKADKITMENELKKKYDKAGGLVEGNILLNSGNSLKMTDNSNIIFSESANLRLPSTKFEDISEIESYEFKNKNRFDLLKINNVNNALLTLSANQADYKSTDVSSIQFMQSENDLQVRMYKGGTTPTVFRNVLFKDKMIDSVNFFTGTNRVSGGDDRIASAEVTKNLYNSLISEYRGNILLYLTGNIFNITNILKLQPGNYYVNSQQGLSVLGLNQNYVTIPGVLIVSSDYDNTENSIKTLRYLPVSTKTDDTNTIAEYIVANNLNVNWVYLRDFRDYYNKRQVDKIVTDTKENLSSKFMSSNYTFTGNTVNIAKSKILVHTHNHTTKGNEKLFFKTNISLSDPLITTPYLRFKITLDGESYSNGDIDIVIIGELTQGNDNEQKEIKVYNKAVGSPFKVTAFVKDTYLWFMLSTSSNNNDNLSFDTYVRLSNIDISSKFMPSVLKYTLEDPR